MRRPRLKPVLRISLRTMLVAIGVLCVLLGKNVRDAKQQQTAVAWVRDTGGDIAYDYELPMYRRPLLDDEVPVTNKLREWIGVDHFSSVVLVRLPDCKVADLSCVAGLKRLKILQLLGTQVDDLSHLESLPELESLSLCGVKSIDLSMVAEIATLRYLSLRGTQVSDVAPLTTLTKLEFLDLDGTRVTDLSPLASMTTLEFLHLQQTAVSNKAIATLQKALPHCEVFR